jgi:hypothetical protein
MPSRWNMEDVTIIDAPIDMVWDALYDIDDWKWNAWTRLAVVGANQQEQQQQQQQQSQASTKNKPQENFKGKLLACYKGDDQQWEVFDCVFGPVSVDDHLLTWMGSVGPRGCLLHSYHTMQLFAMDGDDNNNNNKTRLVHKEVFGGLLPALGVGLPYKQLNRNFLKMSVALKNHIESAK